ncbi:MAG: YaiI/YqxD family protein [Epulopiscium sp.]|nr:YaiI/YqxD family protein [Candidatus Epulonipiscium sp.]
MKIIVDADGCPVVELAISIAKEHSLDIVIVKNYCHEIIDDYATIITVDLSRDRADFYIVNNIEKGDVVITQDYGLAAMVLAKEGLCINQNGLIISSNNIDILLGRRHLNQELRRKYQKSFSKFKKRKKETDKEFENSLRSLLASQSI